MKNLTYKQAREQLTQITTNVFKETMDKLAFYFSCAPVDLATAVGPYKDNVRRLRNSDKYSDHWHPDLINDYSDKPNDTEEDKLQKDFSFILAYLRGDRNQHKVGGALASSTSHITKRSRLFADNNEDDWYSGLVQHICTVAYEIPTLGTQIVDMGRLHDTITDPSLTDEDATNQFAIILSYTRLNLDKHWDLDCRLTAYTRIVLNILACIVMPVALILAIDSKIQTGTFNFFKPLSSSIPRLSKEIIASIELPEPTHASAIRYV